MALGLPLWSMAQTPVADPTAAQIIDALKPAKTRGLRNLEVKEAAPAQPSANAAVPGAAPAASAPMQPASIDLAIHFEFDSSRITAASKKILDALATALAAPELAASRFRIEGHTDNKGPATHNQKLSQARADEVKRTLVARRIAEDRLVAEGKGASAPVNRDRPAAAENRRVRIVSLE